MSTRHTLAAPATLQQDIRKSRFLAQAESCATPEAALAFVERISDPLATHNCWAYRIGQHYRFSDDGEPGGTAGRPILQAIEGQGFDQVAVVVTRWYGGIKLGAGGLARAYGGTAAECLRQAPRTPLIAMTHLRLHCDFALLPVLHARLAEFAAEKTAEDFDAEGAWIDLSLPTAQADAFTAYLRDLSRGRAQVERV